jgi:hypothetical protein
MGSVLQRLLRVAPLTTSGALLVVASVASTPIRQCARRCGCGSYWILALAVAACSPAATAAQPLVAVVPTPQPQLARDGASSSAANPLSSTQKKPNCAEAPDPRTREACLIYEEFLRFAAEHGQCSAATDCEILSSNGCLSYDVAVNRDEVEVVRAKAEQLSHELAIRAGMLDCKVRQNVATRVDCSMGRCVPQFP